MTHWVLIWGIAWCQMEPFWLLWTLPTNKQRTKWLNACAAYCNQRTSSFYYVCLNILSCFCLPISTDKICNGHDGLNRYCNKINCHIYPNNINPGWLICLNISTFHRLYIVISICSIHNGANRWRIVDAYTVMRVDFTLRNEDRKCAIGLHE